MEKQNVKIHIEINPPLMERISKFMGECDLGIDKVTHPEELVLEYQTTAEISENYFREIKTTLSDFFKGDGAALLSFEVLEPRGFNYNY